jgi:membrane protein DedA with SNARE-associated domain
MSVIITVSEFLRALAPTIPLEAFVILGSFLEEIIAPIPSFLVMGLAGTIARVHGELLWYLLVLAVLGALGKTFGTWLIYLAGDKMEDFVMAKFGKYLGVTHVDIEAIGSRLHKGWRDYAFLFLARALPVVPTTAVSFVCGIIKLNRATYISSTFFGTCVRNFLYLYLGYVGLSSYRQLRNGFEKTESVIQVVFGVGILVLILFIYSKRNAFLRGKE